MYDHRTRGLASHFVWTNRSKESLTLDLKQPAAQEVLGELVAEADVLVQNLAPGAAARMGLSFDALHAKHPRLIVCDISGYGADGPTATRAYDLLIQSEAAFLSITGTADEACKAGISIADIAAGMYAYTGILSALLQRGVTGIGSHVEISMLEALAEWMGFPMYYAYDGQQQPGRNGAARDHLSVRPVQGRRRPRRDARPAERARMEDVLRRRAARPGARDRSALRRQRAPLGTPCGTEGRDRTGVLLLTAQDVIARLDEHRSRTPP